MAEKKTYTAWLVMDGKPGHQNQSEGLVQALATRLPLEVKRLPVLPFWKTLIGKLFHKNFVLKLFPSPDLVIGAGHATHKSLLLLGGLFGAKRIVLMKPGLPRFLFNLCLIPEHDDVVESQRVIVTKGVLNRIRTSANKNINQGVILVGGPSKHYGWDNNDVVNQITSVISEMRHIQWTIADSRRTPAETSKSLQNMNSDQVEYVSVDSVDASWLPERLAESQYAWVTMDSVSMIYEALTSGAAIGLLDVRQTSESRVSRGVKQLLDEGRVTNFFKWQEDHVLPEPDQSFNEAERCAAEVIKRCRLGI